MSEERTVVGAALSIISADWMVEISLEGKVKSLILAHTWSMGALTTALTLTEVDMVFYNSWFWEFE